MSIDVNQLGRTSKVIPPPWYKARGGVDGPPPPWVFVMLQYFTFSRKPVMCSIRWGTYYGSSRFWGHVTLFKMARHFGRHLGFYRKLEIIKKRLNLEIFDGGHVEYDIIKRFAAFWSHFLHFRWKTRILQKWLHHLLLMTPYLVSIANDSHQTCVKMCLRDMCIATENGRSW